MMTNFHPLPSLSRVGSLLSARFLKFGLVGGIGTVVNLTGMALIIRLIGWRDWRASALATSLAMLNNYVLNNAWTFRERMRRGIDFFRGYFLYVTVSLVGLLITTGVYTGAAGGLSILLHQRNETEIVPIRLLLLCQFVAILFGSFLNYILSKTITWRT
jgi:putative flippase GtrA